MHQTVSALMMTGNPGWQYSSQKQKACLGNTSTNPFLMVKDAETRHESTLRSAHDNNCYMALDSPSPSRNHRNHMAWNSKRLQRCLFILKIRHSLLPSRSRPYHECLCACPPANEVINNPGEYLRFAMRMIVRLSITWILAAKFPNETGDTFAYPIMLLSWSILGIFRNFQRTWRESRLIGGWQSTSLPLYIALVAVRFNRTYAVD